MGGVANGIEIVENAVGDWQRGEHRLLYDSTAERGTVIHLSLHDPIAFHVAFPARHLKFRKFIIVHATLHGSRIQPHIQTVFQFIASYSRFRTSYMMTSYQSNRDENHSMAWHHS